MNILRERKWLLAGRQLNRKSSLNWVWWTGRRKQTIPHSNSKNLRADSDDICKEESPNLPGIPKLSVPLKPDATELSQQTRHSFIQQIFMERQSFHWVLGVHRWVQSTDRSQPHRNRSQAGSTGFPPSGVPSLKSLSLFNPTFTNSVSLQNLHTQSILFFFLSKTPFARIIYKLKSFWN